MKEKSNKYYESHPLELNVYLFFYVYVVVILIVANILPVKPQNYFLFLFIGLTAIPILLVKFTYGVSVSDKTMALFLRMPFKIILFKVNIQDIETIEETQIKNNPIYKRRRGYRVYCFKKEAGIKLTTRSGKVVIISGVNANEILKWIKNTV